MFKVPKVTQPYIIFFGGLTLSLMLTIFNIPPSKANADEIQQQKSIKRLSKDYVFWYQPSEGTRAYINESNGYLATKNHKEIAHSFKTNMDGSLFSGKAELPERIKIQWGKNYNEPEWMVESNFNTKIYNQLKSQKIYLPFNYMSKSSTFMNGNNIHFTIQLWPNGKAVIYIRNIISSEKFIVDILQGQPLTSDIQIKDDEQWDNLFRRYPWELTVKNMTLNERRTSSTNGEVYHSQPDLRSNYAPPEHIVLLVSDTNGNRKRLKIKFDPEEISQLFSAYQNSTEKLQLQLVMNDTFNVTEALLWKGSENITIPIKSQKILPLYIEPVCDNPDLEISDDELATNNIARKGEHNKRITLKDHNGNLIRNTEVRVQRSGDHKYRYVRTDDNGETVFFRLPLGETIFISNKYAQYKDRCIPLDQVKYYDD